MYNLYDLEVKKELIASLSYVALESGYKFNNKEQFDNIMYRLYNYVKGDIEFNNGVVVNENLKSKLNEFKDIYNDLETPSLEDTEKFIGTNLKNQATANVDFEDTKYKVSTDEVVYFPYAFRPVAVSGDFNIKLLAVGLKGNEKSISTYFTAGNVGSSTKEIRVGIQSDSATSFRISMSTYNENGDFIRTLTKAESVRIADYPEIKIDNIYSAGADVDVYKLITYDFSINENQFESVNVDNINIGDTYFADDIAFLDKEHVTLVNLLNKVKNGISTEIEYQFLKDKIGTIQAYNNQPHKFIVVLANEERTDFLGIVSSYPLYYYNGKDSDALIGLSNNAVTPVELYTSRDSRLWKPIKYAFTQDTYDGASGSLLVKGYPIYKQGLNIVYNNYPIYYNYKFFNGVVSNGGESVNGSLFRLYKTASEDFTVDMLPPGGQIFLGKHKIEDSPFQKLIWRVLDYTDNINNIAGIEKYPESSVLFQTSHEIDYMPLIPERYYSREELQFGNLPIYRWLNSSAKPNEWFEPINEYDLPPDKTNCRVNGYTQRAGFMHYWDKEEVKLLKPMTIDGYENLSILNLNSREHDISGKIKEIPFLHSVLGTSFSVRYTMKIMDYHLAESTTKYEDLDKYAKKRDFGAYHCRDGSRGKYASSSTTSLSDGFAYANKAIAPICCLSKNTTIKKDDFEDGVFSLDIGVEETYFVKNECEAERNVVVNVETQANNVRTVCKNAEAVAPTERIVGLKGEFIAHTKRTLKATGKVVAKTIRDLKANVSKSYKTSRTANFFFVYRFGTKRKTTLNISNIYEAERNVVVENRVDIRFPIKRYLVKDIINIYRNKFVRDVKGILTISKTTKRSLRANLVKNFALKREAITYKHYYFETLRNTRYNADKVYKTKRKPAINYTCEFGASRTVKAFNVFSFGLKRNVYKATEFDSCTERSLIKNVSWSGIVERLLAGRYSTVFNLQRNVEGNTGNEYNLERNIVENIDKENILNRNLLMNLSEDYGTIRELICNSEFRTILERNITENINLDYKTLREAVVNEILQSNLLREVVMSASFENRIERYITENFALDKEAERRVVEDMEKINETIRCTLANAEKEAPTKRVISADDDKTKYVSKHNLLVYTNLLRDEIISLVDARIEEAFASRGL